MPGFNQVSLARHAHGLLVALQQVQARAAPGARPVPPLLHEHIGVIVAALQRLHDQFSQLIGGDPLVVARGDGGIRPDDVLHLVRWWQDGRLTHLIHKMFLMAVRDVATVCAKAPGGPSSVSPSRAPSGTLSRASSHKAGIAVSELERVQKSHAAFEHFLSTPKAAQCSASLVVLQGVLQLVLDAMQLLRCRPPASLDPPPPLPPAPPPLPSEQDSEQGDGGGGDAIACITLASVATTDATTHQHIEGLSVRQAQPSDSEPQRASQPPPPPAAPAMESSTGSVRSRGDAGRHQAAMTAASSSSTTVGVAEGGASPQAVKLPPLQSPQPRASSPQPLRPEDERYLRLCVRHRHAQRLHQAWSGLQDAVLDLLCNSPLLANLTEMLRYSASLLALPGVGGGGGAPRTLALWRQIWSVVPLAAALAHSMTAAAVVSLLPQVTSTSSAGGATLPLHQAPPTPLMDSASAAIVLAALAESSMIPACCDVVLAVSRSALQQNAVTRQNVALAAQQLLAASLRLSAVAEAGNAYKSTPSPSPSPSPAAAEVETSTSTSALADAGVAALECAASPTPDPLADSQGPPAPLVESEEKPAAERVSKSGTDAVQTPSRDGAACGGVDDAASPDQGAAAMEWANGSRSTDGDGSGGGVQIRANGTESRTSGDAVRVSSDAVRVSSDAVRVSSDAVRVSSDAVRFSSDATRVSSDAVRVSSDATRVSGEGEVTGGSSERGKSRATFDGAAAAAAAAAEDPAAPSGAQAVTTTSESAGGGKPVAADDAVDTCVDTNAVAAEILSKGEDDGAAAASAIAETQGDGGSEQDAAVVTAAAVDDDGRGSQIGDALQPAVSRDGSAARTTDASAVGEAAANGGCEEQLNTSEADICTSEAARRTSDDKDATGVAATEATEAEASAAAVSPSAPAPLPPLPAGAAAALAVLSSPAVQYFLCERQASAVVQAYSELVATVLPPPTGASKTSLTAAASASESLSTTWIVEPMLAGAPSPPSLPGGAPAAGNGGGGGGAASGGVSISGVLDAARSCGLDLLPVPALPWSVTVEAALAARPDMRAVQQAMAKTASSASSAAGGGMPVAVDASVGPLGHNLRTDSAGAVSSLSGSPSSVVAAAAAVAGGPLAVQLGRRRKDGSLVSKSSGGSGGGGMVTGPTAGPKLPPLRMPLRQLDSDARRKEAQKVQRQHEALEREAQLLALVKATAAMWQGLIATAATAGPADNTADGAENGMHSDGYVYGAAGRPATPSGHVPSASRALLQLVSAAAVCRAASTVATSQSDGGYLYPPNTAGRSGSPPRTRSGRSGRTAGGHAGDVGAGGDADAPEEDLADLLATLVRNLTVAHQLCSEPERTTLHEQLAALLAAALAASQGMLARTGNPDVSTPLVAVSEACLAWMAEAERQRSLELVASERETEAAELAVVEAEAAQLERALARPDEEFTDEEYDAWQRTGGGDAGADSARGLSRAAAAVARAAAVRLTAAARDAARLRVSVGICEASVRFLVAHHQGIVATLLRAGLLRPGLRLREEHRRHAELLEQTLDKLASLAACCASAVADAHAPRALHAAAATAAPPHHSPVALAAASHAMVATAIGATYAPVLHAVHSALLSVRKCLTVCSQQLAAGGGMAVGLEPVAAVCAVLCAFPGRLVAQLLPAHELAVLGHGRCNDEADATTSPAEHGNEAAAAAASAEASGLTASEASAGDVKDTALDSSYGNGLPAAVRPPYAFGLEPILEVSELSSAISSYPSQVQQQRKRKGDVSEDLDSPADGGGRKLRLPADEQHLYDTDEFEKESTGAPSAAAASRRASCASIPIDPEQAARAAAAVAAAVPYVARAIASSALHTTVPAAWRVFTSLFMQLATSELISLEQQRQQQQQQQQPTGLSWADKSPFSETNDTATECSNYSFSSSRGSRRRGGGGADGGMTPPLAAAAAQPPPLPPPVPPPAGSALSTEQLAALSSATTGLWDLLHVILAVHRGAGAPWPAEVFGLPAERKEELLRVLRELQRPRTPDPGELTSSPPPPPPPEQQSQVLDGLTEAGIKTSADGRANEDGYVVAAVPDSSSRAATQDGVGSASSVTAASRMSVQGTYDGGAGRFSSSTGTELLSGTQDGGGGATAAVAAPATSRLSGGSSSGTNVNVSQGGTTTPVSDGAPGITQDGTVEAATAAVEGGERGHTSPGSRPSGSGIGGEVVSEQVAAEDTVATAGARVTESSTVDVRTSTNDTAQSPPAPPSVSGHQEDSTLQQQQQGGQPEPEQLLTSHQQGDGHMGDQQPSAEAAAAATGAKSQSLAEKIPAWHEAAMLLEQVFSLSEAWKELQLAESVLEG
ncbi:hypothetical protein VaNZ11_003104, partial [Volvox africanus]